MTPPTPRSEPCPCCEGSGFFPEDMAGAPDAPCWVCHGTGAIEAGREVGAAWLACRKSKELLRREDE